MQEQIDADIAVAERNRLWRGNPRIPKWVNPEDVGLDRYFTRAEVAERCHASLLNWMDKDGADAAAYTFIEPAAGNGAFYDLLPPDRRVGLDIMPPRADIDKADFLSWSPPPPQRRLAVVGNPPFGYRAWLALAFVNRAAEFADYVGMILPMAFQSDGKGSPKLRVNGLRLMLTEHLPPNSFVDDSGKCVKINALWQIWQRGVNNAKSGNSCRDWVDLFTVDLRKERLCGAARMTEADFFIQRTFFNEPPKPVRDFADVRYVCGYGIIIKKDRDKVQDALMNADWRDPRYSNKAAHNCRHISMYHIERALTDAGLRDAKRYSSERASRCCSI